MRKIKFFFWSSLLGGIVMVSQGFNNAGVMDSLNEIQQGDFSSLQDMVEAGSTKAKDRAKVIQNRVSKITTGKTNETKFNEKEIYDIDGHDYVFIRGKYYPYNPENIYYIDGEKVYFSVGEQRREVAQDVVTSRQRVKSTGDQEISLNPVKAYSPNNIKNMMKTLKQAQENIGARNKALEEMAK